VKKSQASTRLPAGSEKYRDVPALITELLAPGRPEPQAGVLADGQPHPIAVARQRRETNHLLIERRSLVKVVRLERELGQAVDGDIGCGACAGHARQLPPPTGIYTSMWKNPQHC
jgi:hypothetical protein